MARLEHTSVAELQRALAEVERKRPAQRLLAGIAHKNGVTQTELARWHDVHRRTIYNWLCRLETGPLPDAARDAHRPGRPPKLDPEQRERLSALLSEPPETPDASVWTAPLLRERIRDLFGVDYSLPSCRRLLAAELDG